MGTVKEIGFLVTSIDTMDNIRTFVGNSKIFSGNIQNFTANPYRRVDITAQVAHSMDLRQAMDRIASGVAKIPNVLAEPAPDLKILAHTPGGCVLAVRPYCNNSHYWQVYFDRQQAIRDASAQADTPRLSSLSS